MEFVEHHANESFAVKEQVFRQTLTGDETETFVGKLLDSTSHYIWWTKTIKYKIKVYSSTY